MNLKNNARKLLKSQAKPLETGIRQTQGNSEGRGDKVTTKMVTYRKEQCGYQEIEVHRKTEEDLNFFLALLSRVKDLSSFSSN